MVIGVPKENAPKSDVGTAYIFSGANGSLIRSLDPPTEVLGARFGTALANAGDVNHDGVNDMSSVRRVQVKPTSLAGDWRAYFRIPALLKPNAENMPSFGAAVAGGQDVDGGWVLPTS